jgi:hypothetical protein
MIDDEALAELMEAPTRLSLWIDFTRRHRLKTIAELGVARGAFAQGLLESCPEIATYYLIDPWKHLADWNKPANKDSGAFEAFYDTMSCTAPWESVRIVLRGRTTEVIQSVPDGSLDLAYVDADHTLRGITIDLLRVWAKVRPEGFIGGDDFCPSVWQHHETFEPTLVYPFAVYFAEAMDAPIYALPHDQFLIQKVETGFAFVDKTGSYQDPTLRGALGPAKEQGGSRLREQLLKRIKRDATA